MNFVGEKIILAVDTRADIFARIWAGFIWAGLIRRQSAVVSYFALTVRKKIKSVIVHDFVASKS